MKRFVQGVYKKTEIEKRQQEAEQRELNRINRAVGDRTNSSATPSTHKPKATASTYNNTSANQKEETPVITQEMINESTRPGEWQPVEEKPVAEISIPQHTSAPPKNPLQDFEIKQREYPADDDDLLLLGNDPVTKTSSSKSLFKSRKKQKLSNNPTVTEEPK